jgi:hypothetical protein
MDEILELLETQLTSSEVFTALFELEMAGRIRGLPGKNYVRRCNVKRSVGARLNLDCATVLSVWRQQFTIPLE